MTNMSTPQNPDALARIIVLIYGMLEGGKPFWVYAAIKPSAYDAFNEAKKNNKIDMKNFGNFGELIVAGEGQTPPIEVTLKVAEVYQTDVTKFFDGSDPKQTLEQQK
jgi:hypothetical protein